MKGLRQTKKKRNSFKKRAVSFALVAASCFSLAAAPKSFQGAVKLDSICMTADAASGVISLRDKIIIDSSHGNITLTPGKWYSSPNGEYFFVFDQKVGNLCLYHNVKGGREAVWSSGTRAPGSECVMQKDGNLVIYYTDKNGRRPVWHTGTHKTAKPMLVLKNDGDFYIAECNDKNLEWSSKKWKARPYSWPIPSCTQISERYTENGVFTIIGDNSNWGKNGCKGHNVVAMADGKIYGVEYTHTSISDNTKWYDVIIYYPSLRAYSIYGPVSLSADSSGKISLKKGDDVKQGYVIGKAAYDEMSFTVCKAAPVYNGYTYPQTTVLPVNPAFYCIESGDYDWNYMMRSF